MILTTYCIRVSKIIIICIKNVTTYFVIMLIYITPVEKQYITKMTYLLIISGLYS